MTTETRNEVDIINIEAKIENITIPEEKPEKKLEFLKGEKILFLIAFITAVLCDRLLFDIVMKQTGNIFYFAAIFEISFIILYCIFNWEKIYKKPVLWVIAGLLISLCAWNFIFDYMSSYGALTFFVIPVSLMMFTQIAAENPDLKNITGILKSWFFGWVLKPFSAISRCIEIPWEILSTKTGTTTSVIKKITAAILITIPLIILLIFLLSGADKVFGYYIDKIFASFDIYDFFVHLSLIAAVFMFFYSFFWNARYGKPKDSADKLKKEYKADNLIIYIILGTVLTLYILFCTIQFAYLFASAGLPEGISYSEYAREGFAQIVVISGINLIIFGCVVKFGKVNKPEEKDIILKIMLYIFIAVTGIMLISGFMRLRLYINTFGMTFLRLISAWFIIYLSFVLILCAIRLIKEKLPMIACFAVLLLFSYNILGYINPDSFIVKYNLSENTGYYDVNKWTGENSSYVFNILSDDALNVLIEKGIDKDKYSEFFEKRYNDSINKRSLASVKLKLSLTDFEKALIE